MVDTVEMVDAMTDLQTQTHADDLVRKAGTDADALGRLYDMHYEPIFRFCVHRLFAKDAAEEVTSEIFLQVAQKIGKFRGTTGQDFANWLYAIAVNHCNSHVRKSARRKRIFDDWVARPADRVAWPDVAQPSSAVVVEYPDWPTVYAAISKLKPRHQTIITLRFFEDLSFERIGQILNADPTSVRVALHRILKKLRKLIADV